LDAEWLVREVLTNDAFVFEFIQKCTNDKYMRTRNLVWELLGSLANMHKANSLLEIGFQRQGLSFVNSFLFERFMKVQLYEVAFIRSLIWTFSGICSQK
jgi:hypothetical protein